MPIMNLNLYTTVLLHQVQVIGANDAVGVVDGEGADIGHLLDLGSAGWALVDPPKFASPNIKGKPTLP